MSKPKTRRPKFSLLQGGLLLFFLIATAAGLFFVNRSESLSSLLALPDVNKVILEDPSLAKTDAQKKAVDAVNKAADKQAKAKNQESKEKATADLLVAGTALQKIRFEEENSKGEVVKQLSASKADEEIDNARNKYIEDGTLTKDGLLGEETLIGRQLKEAITNELSVQKGGVYTGEPDCNKGMCSTSGSPVCYGSYVFTGRGLKEDGTLATTNSESKRRECVMCGKNGAYVTKDSSGNQLLQDCGKLIERGAPVIMAPDVDPTSLGFPATYTALDGTVKPVKIQSCTIKVNGSWTLAPFGSGDGGNRCGLGGNWVNSAEFNATMNAVCASKGENLSYQNGACKSSGNSSASADSAAAAQKANTDCQVEADRTNKPGSHTWITCKLGSNGNFVKSTEKCGGPGLPEMSFTADHKCIQISVVKEKTDAGFITHTTTIERQATSTTQTIPGDFIKASTKKTTITTGTQGNDLIKTTWELNEHGEKVKIINQVVTPISINRETSEKRNEPVLPPQLVPAPGAFGGNPKKDDISLPTSNSSGPDVSNHDNNSVYSENNGHTYVNGKRIIGRNENCDPDETPQTLGQTRYCLKPEETANNENETPRNPYPGIISDNFGQPNDKQVGDSCSNSPIWNTCDDCPGKFSKVSNSMGAPSGTYMCGSPEEVEKIVNANYTKPEEIKPIELKHEYNASGRRYIGDDQCDDNETVEWLGQTKYCHKPEQPNQEFDYGPKIVEAGSPPGAASQVVGSTAVGGTIGAIAGGVVCGGIALLIPFGAPMAPGAATACAGWGAGIGAAIGGGSKLYEVTQNSPPKVKEQSLIIRREGVYSYTKEHRYINGKRVIGADEKCSDYETPDSIGNTDYCLEPN